MNRFRILLYLMVVTTSIASTLVFMEKSNEVEREDCENNLSPSSKKEIRHRQNNSFEK